MYRPSPGAPEPRCHRHYHRSETPAPPPASHFPHPEGPCHCPHDQPYGPASYAFQVNNNVRAYPLAAHVPDDYRAFRDTHAQPVYHPHHGADPPINHHHGTQLSGPHHPGLYHSHPSAPITPRRNLTTIILPTRRFLVSTPLLNHLLPRTTTTPTPLSPLSILGPLIPTRFPADLFPDALQPLNDALTLLFERLERISREGSTEHAFFDGLEFRLENARDQLRVLEETFRVAFALCIVLDLDAGMGCAPELAVHLGQFLLGLLPRLYVLGNASSRVVCGVVLGYAKVFRRTEECMAVLRGLWDGLDDGERGYVVSTLRSAIAGAGPRSNARRMWTALGEMGLLGGAASGFSRGV